MFQHLECFKRKKMTTVIKHGEGRAHANTMCATNFALPNSKDTDIVDVTNSRRRRNSVTWDQFTLKFSHAVRKRASSSQKEEVRQMQAHQVVPKHPTFQRIIASLQHRKQKEKAAEEVPDPSVFFQATSPPPHTLLLLLKEDPIQKRQRYISVMSKIPPENTLIKYVGDALIDGLEQEQDGQKQQEENYTVETELLMKLIQAGKWGMAQTIADKIRRRMFQVTTDCQEIACFLDECADS
jgi:hypothetical protein